MSTPDNRVYILVRCWDWDKREYYFPERREIDAHMADTVEDILDGQFKGVDSVFAFNAASGLCSDVSEMVAQKVVALAARSGTVISDDDVRTFIHEQLGAEAVP